MSEYDRRTGVKKLRVRGLKAVTYAAIMKAIGLNIRRAAASKLWLEALGRRFLRQILTLIWRLVDPTEHIMPPFEKSTAMISQNLPDNAADFKIAA